MEPVPAQLRVRAGDYLAGECLQTTAYSDSDFDGVGDACDPTPDPAELDHLAPPTVGAVPNVRP